MATNSSPDGQTSVEYRLGPWRVRPLEGVVVRKGAHRQEEQRLEPKVMEVLRYLLDHPARVVSKEELLDGVWPDTFVEEVAVSRCVSEIRKALGDNARRPRYIETLPKRGFRLLATVDRVPATSAPRNRRFAVAPAKIALLAASVLGGAAWIWLDGPNSTSEEKSTERKPLSMRPVTNSGFVIDAAISPDGNFVAYVESDRGDQSLYLRQLDGGKRLELRPRSRVDFWGLSFTPDGTAIVYGQKSDSQPAGAFYRTSTLGGLSSMLIEGIDSAPSFSPDGSQMTWFRRRHPEAHQSALMVASSDGSGERVLVSVDQPRYFVPQFYTAPSWSPEGTRIAAAVQDSSDGISPRLTVFNVETGEPLWSDDDEWSSLATVVWSQTGDALVAVAQTPAQTTAKVWMIPYPAGERVLLTPDPSTYRSLSLSADDARLLTIRADFESSIWMSPADPAIQKRQVSESRKAGLRGFDLTPDGRILFELYEQGRAHLAVMNVDGSSVHLITDGTEIPGYPRVTRDQRVVFNAIAPGQAEIRGMNLDGTGLRTLARASMLSVIDVTDDDRWIVYTKTVEGVPTIWRVPIEGGEPEQLTASHSLNPAVAPDGSRLAYYARDAQEGKYRIVVRTLGHDSIDHEIDVVRPYINSALRWSQDGRSLLVNTMEGDRSNLWRIPLDGTAAERLTDFTEPRLFWWEPMPDGSGWLVSRGRISRDAVVIENFR